MALERTLCRYWCKKPGNTMCVTDRHDITLAVQLALDPNTIIQSTIEFHLFLTVDCGDDEHQCHDNKACVNKSLRCDGNYDCNDRSDEWFCPMTPVPRPAGTWSFTKQSSDFNNCEKAGQHHVGN